MGDSCENGVPAGGVPEYGGNEGNGFALIVVLFILLIIVGAVICY
ncbi:MAG: YjcZ family sporulation protein [Sporolactobacillus sp.]